MERKASRFVRGGGVVEGALRLVSRGSFISSFFSYSRVFRVVSNYD